MNDLDLRMIYAYRVFKWEEKFEGQDTLNSALMQGRC